MIEIELDSAYGPCVVYSHDVSEEDIMAELPEELEADFSSQILRRDGFLMAPLVLR